MRLIAVTGGQRGVGTTTIALNLAVALALQGQRTILVDADLERGAVADLCGLTERGSILDVLASRRTIHEVLTRGPAGVQILPGVWAPHEAERCSATSQGRLITQLKGLGAHTDLVIVDTGCGRGGFVRRFWQAADLPLVVTTPAAEAVMDCYATIKVLLAGDASIGVQLAVNRVADPRLAADVHGRIAAACRRFLGVRATLAGNLPDDPELAAAAHEPRPLLLRAPTRPPPGHWNPSVKTSWPRASNRGPSPPRSEATWWRRSAAKHNQTNTAAVPATHRSRPHRLSRTSTGKPDQRHPRRTAKALQPTKSIQPDEPRLPID